MLNSTRIHNFPTDLATTHFLQAGVHLGEPAENWFPSNAPFIYGERNQVHIFNLN